jgi:long-chain acyl-CoA synthetase
MSAAFEITILRELADIHGIGETPFIAGENHRLTFSQVLRERVDDLDSIRPGDVVALIGDFNPRSIMRLLHLIDRKAIVVPLTIDTAPLHDYYYHAAQVDWIVSPDDIQRRQPSRGDHPMLEDVRAASTPGLILFSSGTTGRPKAILHDFGQFIARYRTPRPALRTLNFLLFDHIGGVNTLLHTLYNRGLVVVPSDRTPQNVLRDIRNFEVELLPTTPTFLRLMLLSGLLGDEVPASLRVITYGTERMDEGTLTRLCKMLPNVDFRQTYGMSELGILRVKSRARDSLWIKVGGEGVETRVRDGVLHIRSQSRMVGYLNAPSPFDAQGWYDTKDLVEVDSEYLRITGRTVDVISVGGVKVLPEEIERAALEHPDALYAKAFGVANPITGQHIELVIQPRAGGSLDRGGMRRFLLERLPTQLQPHRIRIGDVGVNHRFKRN